MYLWQEILKLSCLISFDWPKNTDGNLKHDVEFHMKSNESLAEHKIKNETERFVLKYKHGNNIYEHRKQKNEWTT